MSQFVWLIVAGYMKVSVCLCMSDCVCGMAGCLTGSVAENESVCMADCLIISVAD